MIMVALIRQGNTIHIRLAGKGGLYLNNAG